MGSQINHTAQQICIPLSAATLSPEISGSWCTAWRVQTADLLRHLHGVSMANLPPFVYLIAIMDGDNKGSLSELLDELADAPIQKTLFEAFCPPRRQSHGYAIEKVREDVAYCAW